MPVVVCASHHHVLRYWLLAAQAGVLPERGVEVVHFDAHPDLALPPRVLRREWREQPGLLVAATDIASFQLAAAWVGLVSRVTWLRPSWADQLPDGERRFRLGLVPGAGMRVDDESDYYVLDDGWAARDALRSPVELEVEVVALDDALRTGWAAPEAQILDIDLDGFATRNPAAERLRRLGLDEATLADVRTAFAAEKLALGRTPPERIEGLERLLDAVRRAASGDVAAQLGAAWTLWRLGLGVGDLWRLRRALAAGDGELPLEALLEEGRSLVGLPEHRADAAGIAATAEALRALLARGAVRPRLVTVARSVGDGFTPESAWPEAERRTLAALEAALGPLAVRYDRGLAPAPPAASAAAAAPTRKASTGASP